MREACLQARVLKHIEDGDWHTERAIIRAVTGRLIGSQDGRAIITDLVWAERLEDRSENVGVREQRQTWLRLKRPTP